MGHLLTCAELATILRITPSSVRRWVREGRIPAIRGGKTLRFSEEEVFAALRPAQRAQEKA